MASLNSPVELPTGRHSFNEFPMTANIQDPTSWDALAHEGTLTRGNSKLTVATDHVTRVEARSSSRPSSRGQQSIRNKPSPAIESPPQELEAPSTSYFPPRGSSAQVAWNEHSSRKTNQDTRSEAGHTAQTSDDYTSSTTSASTNGTNSLPDHQVYSLPTSAVSPKDESLPSPALSSSRSISEGKKSAVPTSKYKKKPPPSLRSSIKRKSQTDAPIDSPMSSYTHVLQSPTNTESQMPMPSELPATATSPSGYSPLSEGNTRAGQAPLQHTKSTASVRKARALHSHPSLPTLRSTDASPPVPTQPSPSSTAAKLRKSIDAARNRPSLYDLQMPTPAPNTPLPDLPTGVQPLSRPVSRDVLSHPTPPPDAYVRPNTSSSTVAPTLRRQDTSPQAHAEMANFMASSSKIVFRRFHDVHIRLLLTLQDEISGLEKELAEIENSNATDANHELRRVKILSELRKLLAEYDHLFGNWNLMQASKADTKTREELEMYLKRPGTNSSVTITNSAIDDLLWLQSHHNDLSCVDLNAKGEVKVSQKELPASKEEAHNSRKISAVQAGVQYNIGGKTGVLPTLSSGGGGGGGYAGGFAALFAACAGKRK